jgi:hypothetical protein
LEQVEELRLRLERQLADLVEEERAALGGLDLALDAPHRGRMRAGKRPEELALDQRLGERGAVQGDERMAGARPVVVDRARELALPGAGLAGQQHVDVERRRERELLQDGRERRAPADDVRYVEERADRRRRVGGRPLPLAVEHAVDERCQVRGEGLGARAVRFRERALPERLLQIQHAAREVHADRRADDRLDAAEPDALEAAEALVEQRRIGDDRLPGRDRLRDDAARDRAAHAVDLVGGVAMRRGPTRGARVLVVVQLEVALAGVGDLDDQPEGVAEKRLGLFTLPECQQPAVELTFPPYPGELRAVLSHLEAT